AAVYDIKSKIKSRKLIPKKDLAPDSLPTPASLSRKRWAVTEDSKAWAAVLVSVPKKTAKTAKAANQATEVPLVRRMAAVSGPLSKKVWAFEVSRSWIRLAPRSRRPAKY